MSTFDTSRRLLWLAVFVPLLVLYMWTLRTNPSLLNADAPAVVPSAVAVAEHGSPVMWAANWPTGLLCSMPAGHGAVVSNRTPGLIYLAAPLYWLFRVRDPLNDFPASALAAVITSAAMATLALTFARFVSHRTALASGLVAGTATTTWAVSGVALWPHGPDQLVIAISLSGLASQKHLRVGIAYAVGLLVRPLLGFSAAVQGLVASWKQRSIKPAIAIAFPAACCLLLYAWYAHHYWSGGVASGSKALGTATHGYGNSLTDIGLSAWRDYCIKVAGFLLSPSRGILTVSPFLLALLPGLRRAWRAAPSWVRSSAGGAALYMLIQLKGEVFTGGWEFWGYRYALEPLTLSAPLLLLCWRKWTSCTARRRATFGALVILSVTMQSIGAICFPGPDQDKPWSFLDFESALSGSRGLVAFLLLIVGACSALLFWVAHRHPRGAHLANVSGAHPEVTVGGAHDDEPAVVDVDRAPDHSSGRSVVEGHLDVLADRAAAGAVGRG